ncbi:MAG: hypothetical protein EZS28_008595 [Streblomastix strix]|uniref:Uncharacterized protein n=1 Tax=Streblomastix strix TaxID=222440 RepID=A0A5J4WMT0_9EUKA|nr:MAG: hypothetical protein EZS28_008595 [Streblomastix strix]
MDFEILNQNDYLNEHVIKMINIKMIVKVEMKEKKIIIIIIVNDYEIMNDQKLINMVNVKTKKVKRMEKQNLFKNIVLEFVSGEEEEEEDEQEEDEQEED